MAPDSDIIDQKVLKCLAFNRQNGFTIATIVLLLLVGHTSASVCTSYDQQLTASTSVQYLTSPNYPGSYDTGKTCQWKIATQSDSYFVKLEFVSFSLQYTSTCSNGDYVEVRDGASQSSDLIKQYCYSAKPQLSSKIYSSGRYIHVKFRSDYFSSINSGFRIRYSAVYRVNSCSASYSDDQNSNIVLTSSTGTFKTPNYPFSYPNNEKCIWKIKLPSPNSIVNLTFTSFELETGFGSCASYNDYVEIFDGPSVGGASLGRYCGTSAPPSIYTTGNKLTIVFDSDTSTVKKGFLASYSSVSSSGVSGTCKNRYVSNQIQVTGSGGAIASPNYPLDYPSNMDCTWKVTVPSGKRVKLSFVGTYSVESGCSSSSGLNNDYIQIRDGSTTASTSLGKFCGSTKPSPLVTSGRYATVRFKTDSGLQYKGFYMIYEATSESTAMQVEGYCSPYVTTAQTFYMKNTSGTITSPNFPSNYPPNMNCAWRISVSSDKRVKFSFKSMDIEYTSGCYRDYVELRDGYSSYSKTLGSYCGYSIPRSAVYSTGRYMYVKFYSGYSTQDKGFKAYFKEVDKAASVGLIVGIIVGFIILTAVIVTAVCCCKKKGAAGAVHRPVHAAGATTMTSVSHGTQQQHPPPLQGAYPQQAPPQGVYPQGICPAPQTNYAPPMGAYPSPQGGFVSQPRQGGYPAPPPQGSYPPPSPQGGYPLPPPQGIYPPQGNYPPSQGGNLPPPPPYPGEMAPSAPPQYPPQGQPYPWQPNDETKATPPVVT